MFSTYNFLRILSIVFALSAVSNIYCQNGDFLEGSLVDSKDRSAVSFATIRIKNKSVGIISNMDGGFKIPNKFKTLGDTIIISSIGYTSKEILLSSLDQNAVNIIQLVAKIESLDEVVLVASKKIKKLRATQIVRKAVDQISENYPYEPFSYVGYYRDYQLKEGKHINLNEAILKVSDPGFGYNDKANTRIQLYTSKKNLNFPRDTVALQPYNYENENKIIPNATIDGQGGNEYTILRLHDAIRNHNINTYDFINELDRDLIKNHRLKLLPETSINDMSLYVIQISKNLEDYKVSGKIYITKGDFKIYKMQYAVYDKRASLNKFKKSDKKRKTPRKEKVLFEILVEYQLRERKMYPNYISFNNSFAVLQPPQFKTTLIQAKPDKKHFELTFNKEPLLKGALNKKNYKLWFQGNKVQIDSISVSKNTVFLFPKDSKFIFNPERTKLLEKTNNRKIRIEVKRVKDLNGNVINERIPATYYQYREFFVQELLPEGTSIFSDEVMSINRPIFKNQPTNPPKNLSDYWMNTPLKD